MKDRRRSARWSRPRQAKSPAVETLEGRQLLTIAIAEKGLAFDNPYHVAGFQGITAGPDGNLWFTESTDEIGAITPSGQVTEFAIPGDGYAQGITSGTDGNLWFLRSILVQVSGSLQSRTLLERMTPAGEFTELPLPEGLRYASSITTGPDGNLWIAGSDAIGRVTTAGVVTEFPLPDDTVNKYKLAAQITPGPDGNLWFTEQGYPETDKVGRITPAGVITEFPVPSTTGGSRQGGIATGPDGNLWFTIFSYQPSSVPDKVVRLTPAGDVTVFPMTGPDLDFIDVPDLAAGADGNLWITGAVGKVFRLAPDGTASVFRTPSSRAFTGPIASGSDGNLWFAESNSNRVGQVVLDAPAPDGTLTAVAGPSIVTKEGARFSGTVATFTDSKPGGQPGDYAARIVWGDGTTNDGEVRSDGHGGFVVNGVNYYRGRGSFDVKVTIFDTRIGHPGGTVTATTTASVGDAPLVPSTGVKLTAYRGQPGPIRVAFASTPDTNDVFTATIDWGDGTTSPGTVKAYPAPRDLGGVTASQSIADPPYVSRTSLEVFGTHTYRVDGTYNVRVNIRDDEGTAATAVTQLRFTGPPVSEVRPLDVSAHPGMTTGPVPVGLFRTVANVPPEAFTATVDWGDGTAPSTGKVVRVREGYAILAGHTYAKSGPYTVRATLRGADHPVEITGRAGVTGVSGRLDAGSDTGLSHEDGITMARQPRYVGTAATGTVVQLFARRAGAPSPVPIGRGVTDARGKWSIVSATLDEGSYTISAIATSPDGRTKATIPLETGGRLVVDTTPPRVTGATLDPRRARVVAQFRDNLSGLDSSSLALPSFSLGRVIPTGLRTIPLRSPAVAAGGLGVALGAGRPIAGGRHVLRIVSGGVRDLAGNALDGEFSGALPSGDGRPGGDFVATFLVAGSQPASPSPLVAAGRLAARPGRT